MTPANDEQFDAKVQSICALYEAAPYLRQQGIEVVSTDELTGVHALERTHPGLPLTQGKAERRVRVHPTWHQYVYS